MPLKCIRVATGKCVMDAEFIYSGTAYCMVHAKEEIERWEKLKKADEKKWGKYRK